MVLFISDFTLDLIQLHIDVASMFIIEHAMTFIQHSCIRKEFHVKQETIPNAFHDVIFLACSIDTRVIMVRFRPISSSSRDDSFASSL
jgi:hypothetical protein